MATVAGVDAHGRVFTVAVCDGVGRLVDHATFGNDPDGWRRAQRFGSRLGVEVWAVEGSGSHGRVFTDTLLASGRTVLEVPTRVTVRQRHRQTRSKSDEIDALACARAGLGGDVSIVIHDPSLEALRVVVRAREALVRHNIETQNRVRAWIGEIDPVTAGAVKLSRVSHWEHLDDALTGIAVTPHGEAVVELVLDEAPYAIDRIRRIDRYTKRLESLLPPAGWALIDEVMGIGVIGAATILAQIGNVHRFRSDAACAMWAAAAPLEVSSAGKKRHRFNPRGNRTIDHVLEIAIRVQRSHHGPADAYINRRLEAGDSYKQAARALKRHLIRTVYNTLKTHQTPNPLT